MTELQPYPAYVPSNVEWLTHAPSAWTWHKLGVLFDLQRRPVAPGDEVVTAFRDGQVTLRKRRRVEGFTEADKEIGYQGIRSGDLVIHNMDAFAGAIGVSDSDGKSTPVYSALLPRAGQSAAYYAYLLRHLALTGYIAALARGIRERSTDFRWASAREVVVPVPPEEEQQRIVSFLEAETAEIDAFIADQEELIRLLTERRAATISHAVTNGAGDPTNAQLLPLRRIITHLDQGWSPNCESAPASEDDWGVLKVGCVNGGVFIPGENKALPPEEVPRPEFSVRGGDILVSRGNTRELVGSAAIVERDYPRLLLSDLLYRMRVDEGRTSASYVALALGSRGVRGQIEASSKGTSASMQKISQTDVRELRLWMPPLDIQREISTRIADEMAVLDAAVADAREAIVLSRERRAALISAAVTGKIDVREHVRADI